MKNKISNNKKLLIISHTVFAVVCIFLVIWNIKLSSYIKDSRVVISRDNDNPFKLTNPILDCESFNPDSNAALDSEGLKEKTKEVEDKYSLTHLSLYYRDLNNGPWVGIKEHEVFSPASLLKVPIFISFLKESEEDESLLKKVITINDTDFNKTFRQNIVDPGSLELNKQYTLEEIANTMIVRSDNTAVAALLKNINTDKIGSVFKTVGVPYKDINTEVNVSVKNYAGFFRVLFNSSYLSRDMSEKALEVMTKSDYNDGIVAGVPKGTLVAHKFGERAILGEANSTQLHDCGIVYYPNKPYIICVMTRGNDLGKQSKAISELSSYIYEKVKKEDK